MKFVAAEMPPKVAKRERKARYRATTNGSASDAKWNAERMQRTEDAYLARTFVAWDGEGINEPDGSHTYFLLASSAGHHAMERVGLSTMQCFDLLWSAHELDAVHVVFGGSYDINMMMRDMSRELLTRLYAGETVVWTFYKVTWRVGKFLRLTRDRKTVTLYDVSPFFQTNFINACDEYLGDNWEARDQIVAGKADRGTFTWDAAANVDSYNAAELRNLVQLMNELRTRLFRVGIRLRRWDGPGAIASEMMRQHDVRKHIGVTPDRVAVAVRHAYAGGRFECMRTGHNEQGAFQYDIRSAYPAAMVDLPCLVHGEWRHISKPTTFAPFGLYFIRTAFQQHQTRPQPSWSRQSNGEVHYTDEPTYNWFWSPEAQIIADTGATRGEYETFFGVKGPAQCVVVEGWEWHQSCDDQPFAWVEGLYNKREALKRAKDGAQVALKLGLNSLYGKTCQQVGWKRSDDGTLRVPPFHCLEWAGFITSYTRAKVYRAAMLAPDDVIAFETDAVFMRVPVDLPLSNRLGDWELTEYTSLTYLKSGVYFGTRTDGAELVAKMRGMGKGSLTRDAVLTAWRDGDNAVTTTETRFITLGQALMRDMRDWRRWITSERETKMALAGKRIEAISKVLDNCEHHDAHAGDGWMETMPCGHLWDVEHALSCQYNVEWINPPDDERATLLRESDHTEGWE